MNAKSLIGALLLSGAILTMTGCPEKKDGGAAAGGTTGGSPAATTGAGSGGAVSDDDAHKLYQAAAQTGDSALIMEVYKKLGLTKADGTPDQEKLTKFTTDHGTWAQKNVSFIQEVSTPEKAKDYVNKHK